MKKVLACVAATCIAGTAFAAPTVEIAAGETLVVTDFKTMDVGDVTIITNSLIKLNEGCVVKIPQSPENAANYFRYQIQLLGGVVIYDR